MTLVLYAVAFGADDPARLAQFWAQLLGRDVTRSVTDPTASLVPGLGSQLNLAFAPSSAPRPGRNPLHLHVTSDSGRDGGRDSGRPEGQADTVARALALGARHRDVGQRPEERHVVLEDPEGNEFCVIEADNRYLAGTGPLGEVACDGSHATGVFYSSALGWPLVWDEGEESAIQSPQGGTKIGWGGPPLAPVADRERQWFEVIAGDDDDLLRLERLGATTAAPGRWSDPDGSPFRVHDAVS